MTANSPEQRFTLPARLRVKRASVFQEAYRQGEKTVGRYFVLWLRKGDDSAGRLGVVASKRIGHSVARSRGKRRLRELFRLHQHELRADVDYILVARAAILKAPWPQVSRDFRKVCSRAKVLKGG